METALADSRETSKVLDRVRLDPNQLVAAIDLEGPVLIHSCPGAGKTRVLAARVALLLERGVPQENILCFTFTNRAAEEMRRRIEQYSGQCLNRMWVGTFHSVCARILRHYAPESLIPPGFAICDEEQSNQIVKEAIREVCHDYLRQPTSMLRNEIARFKRNTIPLDDWCQTLSSRAGEPYAERFRSVYLAYQALLRQSGALDFDDLTLHAVRLLQDSPMAFREVSSRFHYICVDEYQDTADIEGELIRLLSSTHNNLCVVGDVNQAIYGWRGSNHRLIADFPKHYPGAKVHTLNINYRSGRRIVALGNRLMSLSRQHVLHECRSYRAETGHVRYARYETDAEETRSVADVICELISNCRFQPNDIAVLGRMHFLLEPIRQALIRCGVPCAAIKDQPEFDEGSEGVRLLTIHQAKGLEFRIVFLVGMEEGVLPCHHSLLDPEQMEEERRLCYVAVTRAINGLYITCSDNRAGRKSKAPSRFLADLLTT